MKFWRSGQVSESAQKVEIFKNSEFQSCQKSYKNREISTFLGMGGIIRGPMSAQPEISTFKGSIKNPAKCPRDARGQKNPDS